MPQGSKSVYRGTYKSSTKKVITPEAVVKPTLLEGMDQFFTN
jgi:hypothetical protein